MKEINKRPEINQCSPTQLSNNLSEKWKRNLTAGLTVAGAGTVLMCIITGDRSFLATGFVLTTAAVIANIRLALKK